MTTNKDNQDAQGSQEIQLQDYPVTICNACINLVGNMCHTPGCAFIRCTMNEVKEFLNQTQICPLVNGEKIYTIDPIPQPSKKGHGEEIQKLEINWSCRFHPTDWFHETGCPHMEWTKEQLQGALETSKKSQAHQLTLLHATDQKARREEREKAAAIVDEIHFWRDKQWETFDSKAADSRLDYAIQKILNQKFHD